MLDLSSTCECFREISGESCCCFFNGLDDKVMMEKLPANLAAAVFDGLDE